MPILLRLTRPEAGRAPAPDGDDTPAPSLPTTTRKTAKREDRDQASRKDSFIIHRFEAIMSWAESLNLNRTTDDDDPENAQKAADDQDHITLSDHVRRAASRLRLHLDLSPLDAEHERLSARFTYPEWNHRAGAMMPDHTSVLEAEGEPGAGFTPDPRLVARVRRQFAPLHPRRVLLSRQIDGTDLDLDAIVASVTKTGRCVVVHEATLTSGFGGEIAALVQEHCFYHLEAPVVRVTGWDTPYPHAQEWDYFPGPARVGRALAEVMEG